MYHFYWSYIKCQKRPSPNSQLYWKWVLIKSWLIYLGYWPLREGSWPHCLSNPPSNKIPASAITFARSGKSPAVFVEVCQVQGGSASIGATTHGTGPGLAACWRHSSRHRSHRRARGYVISSTVSVTVEEDLVLANQWRSDDDYTYNGSSERCVINDSQVELNKVCC